ncbi:WD40-repeat-containing domain protein [Lenzites betulinus]|nr:WD40-repeat-containing domain protein [Lenzites betulinus]
MTGYDTDWPADSAEFCPHPDATDIFVVGTYKLEQTEVPASTSRGEDNASTPPPETPKRPQKRRGKCLLFRVQEGDQFELLQETELAAILDMKWCHRGASALPLLAIADSEGHITLHELHNDESRLRLVQTISCASTETLCLSLDWSNRRSPASSALGNLIVSLSDGSLSLLQPEGTSGLTVTDSWHAHDYEPWIAAWNYWDTNVVYSGGDDLKMKGWDIRQGGTPTFVNKRFDAGVTTIQSHPHIEHILAVGSYDNTVRIFDTRKPLVPLTEADVGGGAWRVKWHPSPARKSDLLVACMHDGFKVVKLDFGAGDPSTTLASSDQSWEVVKRFDGHTSLAYGADWSFARDGGDEDTFVASCSFYDHTLQLWRA